MCVCVLVCVHVWGCMCVCVCVCACVHACVCVSCNVWAKDRWVSKREAYLCFAFGITDFLQNVGL